MLELLTLLIMASGPLPAAPQPASLAETRMLIDKAKQEIAEEEKTWAAETAREKEAETRRRQRFSEFNQDKIRIQQGLSEQEEKIKALLATMEGHQLREKDLQSRFHQLNATVSERAKVLRSDLALGLPYRLDKRSAVLDLLMKDIEAGNISPEEAFNRLWVVYQNESRLAQEAEVYSGDFSGDEGDPIQVKYLRVGRQILAFSSLDGSKLGMLRTLAPGKYEWVREKDLKYESREAIKLAISTAEGKAVPGFVPVPIWRVSEESGK